MFHIIDNTLTTLDHNLPSKDELHSFCEKLFTIGVDAIEITKEVYRRMEELPEQGKYILNITYPGEKERYPGLYRYVCRYEGYIETIINEIQLNDVKELLKLRVYSNCKELRIVGMDDLMCYSYEKIMKEIKNNLSHCNIIFAPENTFKCASALAVQWGMDIGMDVTTSFTGCKNNAATEEVIMAMRLAVRHKPNRNLTVMPELTKLYEKFVHRKISNKKPIIGKNIFQVESGIHADGIKKNPATYEAYEPACVGGKSEIIIGKHSGQRAIKLKMEELKLQLPNEAIVEEILHKVKHICTENRKSLNEEEFRNLVLRGD